VDIQLPDRAALLLDRIRALRANAKLMRRVLLCTFLVCPPSAWAQAADPKQGRILAENVCMACHRIEAGETGPGPNPDAPSFFAIAKMPSVTALSISVFLRSPHVQMPDLILEPNEISAAAAYILSLSGK
jgi:mono/diheme cytochrome c family protein